MSTKGVFGALVVAVACLLASRANAQVIWSENFTYVDGTNVGGNNNTANPASDWNSVCPTCLSGDWYYVRNNVLEARDTNGPATMTTEVIDISAFPQGVEVTMNLSEAGPLEGCPGGISPGCNNVDWIRIEYQLNGGAFVDVGSALGGLCTGACAGAVYYTYGDFGTTTVRICPLFGDSLRLRISCQNWASDENLRIDNLVVQGQTCNPGMVIDSVHNVICNGASTGFIWAAPFGGALPFTYSIDGINFFPSTQFNNLPAGNYTITQRDGNGALTTINNVIITEGSALSFSDSTVNVTCNGLNNGQVFALNAAGGTPSYLYALDNPPFIASNAFPNISPGNHLLIMRDANGCIDTVPFTVTEPAVLALSGNTSISACSSATGTATVAPTGGTPTYSYLWNSIPTQNTATATNLAPGTYLVSVTDFNGCNDTLSVQVAQANAPTISFVSSTVSACTSSTGTATVAGNGGTPGYSYLWNSLPSQTTSTATGLAPGTYLAQITDQLGCTDTLSIAVLLASSPTLAVVGSTASACTTGTGTGTLSASGGNPGYSYLWNIFPTQSTATATGLLPGSYLATVTDALGCTDTASVGIVQATFPIVTASPDDSICLGQGSAQLFATGSAGQAGFNFSWACAGGNCPLDSLGDDDPLATPAVNTVFYVQGLDGFGCPTNVDSVEITVLSLPVADAGNAGSVCPGNAFQLSGSGLGNGPFGYAWQCPPLINPCTLDSLSISNPSASPLVNSTYFLQVTDQFGCLSAFDSVLVSLYPVPVADAGIGDTVCPLDTVQLSGSGSNAGPNYTFQWSPATGLSASNVPNPQAVPSTSILYYLDISSNGCPGLRDSVFVEVQYAPVALAGMDTVLCLGDTLTLAGLAIGTAPSHTLVWTGPTGILNPNGQDTLVFVPQQTADYVLVAYPPAGCRSLPDTVHVDVEILEPHSLPGNPVSCMGEPLEIGVPPQNGFTYTWSPISALDDAHASLTSLIGTNPVVYTLTATDTAKRSLNCRTQEFNVVVAPTHCEFQNVISPNGDGINDRLDLGSYYHDVHLSIFDRWGKRIYTSDHYQNDWSGTTMGGGQVPDGVYYYFVRANIMPSNSQDYKLEDYEKAYPLTLLR
jgi:gliding motility-associated-like protein